MYIQINSTGDLENGTKIVVTGTGELISSSTDDKKEPSFKISLKDDDSDDIITVVPSSEMTKAGMETGSALLKEYPELKDDQGSIVGTIVEKIEFENFFSVYKVEVDGSGEFTSPKLEAMETMDVIELTIKGSILQHAAKIEVVNDFLEGEEVVTHIVSGESGEPTILYPKHLEDHAGGKITAGEIKWSEDDKATIMKVLEQKETLEAVVFESENNTYKVRVGIESDEMEAILTGKKIESIEETLNRVHKEVGTPMDTLESIHVYLKSQGVPNKQVRQLLDMIRPYDESVVDFIPEEPNTPYQDNKGLLSRAIAYLLGGESVLMSGDAATGKNLMVETLSWVIQKPYRFYSISIQTDKYDLTGRTVLQNQSEGGGTIVQDSFLISMMKHGGFILLDEINASNPAVMTVLHSVVEKGHKMIDVESSDERVIAKEDFVLFGAMNPGYAGTGDLNEALHSRFATLNFGKNDDIQGLLGVHHESKDAPKNMLKQVNQLYVSLFENVQDGALDAKVLSFRRYAAAVNYAAQGIISLKDALIDNVANMVLDPHENEIIVDAIDIHVG